MEYLRLLVIGGWVLLFSLSPRYSGDVVGEVDPQKFGAVLSRHFKVFTEFKKIASLPPDIQDRLNQVFESRILKGATVLKREGYSLIHIVWVDESRFFYYMERSTKNFLKNGVPGVKIVSDGQYIGDAHLHDGEYFDYPGNGVVKFPVIKEDLMKSFGFSRDELEEIVPRFSRERIVSWGTYPMFILSLALLLGSARRRFRKKAEEKIDPISFPILIEDTRPRQKISLPSVISFVEPPPSMSPEEIDAECEEIIRKLRIISKATRSDDVRVAIEDFLSGLNIKNGLRRLRKARYALRQIREMVGEEMFDLSETVSIERPL